MLYPASYMYLSSGIHQMQTKNQCWKLWVRYDCWELFSVKGATRMQSHAPRTEDRNESMLSKLSKGLSRVLLITYWWMVWANKTEALSQDFRVDFFPLFFVEVWMGRTSGLSFEWFLAYSPDGATDCSFPRSELQKRRRAWNATVNETIN